MQVSPLPQSLQQKHAAKNSSFILRCKQRKKSQRVTLKPAGKHERSLSAEGLAIKLTQREAAPAQPNLKPFLVFCKQLDSSLAETQPLDSGTASTIEQERQLLKPGSRKCSRKRISAGSVQPGLLDSAQYKFSAWECEQVRQRNKTLISQFH